MLLVQGDPTSEISGTLAIERIGKNGFPAARTNPDKDR
jgi:hypothetical protein